LAAGIDPLVSGFFNEGRFGVDGSVRAKLRRELVRAGFFRADAITYYIFSCWLPSSSLPISWATVIGKSSLGWWLYNVPRGAGT